AISGFRLRTEVLTLGKAASRVEEGTGHISSVVIATVLPFFLAELSLARPLPVSSRGAL
nr:hypothetical protein [Tanacetum cinerariifolium]